VRARLVVAAKCAMCLVAAAAGGPFTSAVAVFRLSRLLGAYWAGPELKVRPAKTTDIYAAAVAWLWRVEVAAGIIRAILVHEVGAGPADVVFVGSLVAVLGVPHTRLLVRSHLIAVRAGRRWSNILAAVIPPPATPIVTASGTTPAGAWATVRIGPGGTVKDLTAKADALAAGLAVGAVKVDGHPTNAGWAQLTAVNVDPLLSPAPRWPWLDLAATSLWWPIPVGIDEAGRPVTVTLAEHNLLLGGEPGAGKSVALSQLVAAAALDTHAGLWLLDDKLVELAIWRRAATGWAGTDIFEPIGVLRQVATVMDARYQQLLDECRRKITAGTALQVVVIDELAHYLTWPDKKARDAFTDVLRDLVSRGRAAGIVVIAATQKPAADVVPTSLRDLFGYRWALRCTTNAASDTILGSGWATEGVTAASIAPQARGRRRRGGSADGVRHPDRTHLRTSAHRPARHAVPPPAGRRLRARPATALPPGPRARRPGDRFCPVPGLL